MHSPAITAAPIPATTPATTTATSCHHHEHDITPDRLDTKQAPVLTNDFHLDTFFNPVWTSGPHVFSFAKDGTVVRPETYALEPYPGYHAERCNQRLESVDASHFQGFSMREQKPWKNVAITEQDDAEFEALRERARVGAVGEWRQHPPYGPAPSSTPEGPELVYTWPPKQHGW